MKKQLLIAAVAATMTSVAIADISISGAAKVNYTNTDAATNSASDNAISHEADLAITGKSGDTTFVQSFTYDEAPAAAGDAGTNTLKVENSYMTTKIGDVSLKAGRYKGGDNNLTATSGFSNGNYSASATVGGVKIVVDGDSYESTTDVTASGSFGGVNVSFHADQTEDEIKLSGSFGGVDLSYHNFDSDTANSDMTAITASTAVNGVNVTVASVDVDASANEAGEDFFDIAAMTDNGDDLMGIKLSTAVAGNTVAFARIALDSHDNATDADVTKVIVTRPLASGATFEATYTDVDEVATANDTTTLDLELAVKF